MAEVIHDPAFRTLYAKLAEEITVRVYALASGGAAAIPEDTKTTAEKYAAQVAYIEALNSVVDTIKELEQERFGTTKSGE